MLSLLSNQGRIDIATIVATVPLPVDGGGPPFPPSAPSIRFGVRVQWAAHRYEIRPRPDRVRRHVRARSMERPVDGAKGGAPGNRAPVVVCGIDVARAARALARLAVDAGVAESTDVRVGSGDLEQQLLTTARDEQATVLVVGSRGRGAVKAALLGSVSTDLIGVARCPVLVVPPQAEPPGAVRVQTTAASMPPPT
jgi:hypothetical protein